VYIEYEEEMYCFFYQFRYYYHDVVDRRGQGKYIHIEHVIYIMFAYVYDYSVVLL
jgi:hypothetical protein